MTVLEQSVIISTFVDTAGELGGELGAQAVLAAAWRRKGVLEWATLPVLARDVSV